MNVRVDHRGGCRAQLRQQRVVAFQVPAGIDDDGVTVTHEHITQRPFSDAIELYHVRQGRRGRQPARDVHRFPGGHPADDRIRLVAALTQKRRGLLARVAMTAHDGDRA